jgi:hypothetical protein
VRRIPVQQFSQFECVNAVALPLPPSCKLGISPLAILRSTVRRLSPSRSATSSIVSRRPWTSVTDMQTVFTVCDRMQSPERLRIFAITAERSCNVAPSLGAAQSSARSVLERLPRMRIAELPAAAAGSPGRPGVSGGRRRIAASAAPIYGNPPAGV